LVFLEFTDDEVNDALVKVLAAKVSVARRCLDLKDAIIDREN